MDSMQEHLKARESEIINMLKNIVELESPSYNKVLTDMLVNHLNTLFTKLGEVSRVKQEVVGDNLRIEYGKGEKQVLILCHMDTVWEEGEILKRPFKIENDKIYGPGLLDMKFGIAQVYFALSALADSGINLGYKVVVLLNSDEEKGSIYSKTIIENEASKSECVLVLEFVESKNQIKTSRKGIGNFKLMVEGKSAHAGTYHHLGINAVKELAHKIIELEGMTDYDKGMTVNVGVVKGGLADNVVPDYAEIMGDFRFMTTEQGERLNSKIMSLEPNDQRAKLTITSEIERQPFEFTQENARLFGIVKKAGRDIGIDLEGILVGGVSDGNFTSALGIPTIDGLGAAGHGAHTRDEYILKECITERILLLINILLELSKINLNFK